MDPVIHAWYKGEAIRTYLYLHNFGAGPELQNLVATRILSADEIGILNSRHDPVQDYYPSPKAAGAQATEITTYIHNVALLHAGKYQQLDPIGRMRFLLFIRTGLYLPTSWDFLDPSISS